MEIQAGSHNGDPRWFTQRRFKPVPKTLYTMELQGGSHNGDPNLFPKHITPWRSNLVPTTEI